MSELFPKRFKRVYVEITNACQLSCSFCLPLKRPILFMNEEQFVRILTEIKPYTDYLYLHVKGEPLVHPNLKRFLDLALQFKFQVNITTNGMLLEENSELLSTHPATRQINVSLHALQELTEVEQKTYVHGLVNFLNLVKNKENKYVSLRFWLGNNPLKKATLDFLNEAYDLKLNDESKTLFPNVFINTEDVFVWPEQSTTISPYAFCYGLKDHFAILVDGSVIPCCLDGNGRVVLGNILETPFKDIIEGDAWEKLSLAFNNRQNLPQLCLQCSYKNRFAR
ncbi:MAG: radical SAM/SPASM domain-containing protein [Bacilli bacterium]